MALSVLELDSKQYLSYASVAEADEYIAGDLRYAAAWGNIGEAKGVKERALIFATRQLDTLGFKGERTEGLPRLRFPDTDPDTDESALDETNSLAVTTQFPRDGSAEIPPEIEVACALQAAYLIANPSVTAAVPAPGAPQRKKIQAGRTSIEYFESSNPPAPTVRPQEPDVLALLGPFLAFSADAPFNPVATNPLTEGRSEEALA